MITFLKELFVGRPRIIKHDGGEIILKNISPEVAEKIKSLLTPGAEATVTTPVAEEEESLPMEHFAIGTFQDKDSKWKLGIINFNGTEAEVVEIITCGAEKIYAIDHFKKYAVKYKLV